jgi:hypothetical protein
LKELLNESISPASAQKDVQQTKKLIAELESRLPPSSNANFRERFIACLESESVEPELQKKAKKLLIVYEKKFGVKDLTDNSG